MISPVKLSKYHRHKPLIGTEPLYHKGLNIRTESATTFSNNIKKYARIIFW